MTKDGLLLLIAALVIVQSVNGMNALRQYWKNPNDKFLRRALSAFWWILFGGILLVVYPVLY